MLYIVLLLLLITACGGDWSYLCTMPQWEGLEASLTGKLRGNTPVIIKSLTRISYDLNNTRLATEADIVQNGVTSTVKNIFDYKQVNLARNPSLTNLLERCVYQINHCPENFYMTMTKTFYGFLYEPEPEDLFIFEFRGDVNSSHHILQTTYTGDPVFETVYGEVDGVPVFSNSEFLNITIGIKDPEVFVPPPSCNQGNYELNGSSPKLIGVHSFSLMEPVDI